MHKLCTIQVVNLITLYCPKKNQRHMPLAKNRILFIKDIVFFFLLILFKKKSKLDT